MRSRADLFFCQCYDTSCCILLFRNCIYHSDSISSAFAKLSKSATRFVMSVSPNAQEHFVYRWTYFCKHFRLGGGVLKSEPKSRVGLKTYENNRHFTWIPINFIITLDISVSMIVVAVVMDNNRYWTTGINIYLPHFFVRFTWGLIKENNQRYNISYLLFTSRDTIFCMLIDFDYT